MIIGHLPAGYLLGRAFSRLRFVEDVQSRDLVAASMLGFLVGRIFGGEAIYALVIGSASLLVAAGLTLRVRDEDDVTKRRA